MHNVTIMPTSCCRLHTPVISCKWKTYWRASGTPGLKQTCCRQSQQSTAARYVRHPQLPAKVAEPQDTVEANMVYTMSPMPKVASGLMQLAVLQISKFRVSGMHCSSCSTAVQKALSVTPGVERASVSLTLEQAEVVYDPGLVKEVSHQLKSQPKCNKHCDNLRLASWQYAVHVCSVISSVVVVSSCCSASKQAHTRCSMFQQSSKCTL